MRKKKENSGDIAAKKKGKVFRPQPKGRCFLWRKKNKAVVLDKKNKRFYRVDFQSDDPTAVSERDVN